MIEITQVERAEILRKLPEESIWNEIAIADDVVDVLICGAGFEDRATAILEEFPDQSAVTGLLVIYPINERDNSQAIAKFTQSRVAGDWIPLKYSRYSFLQELRQQLKALQLRQSPRIVIDLSALSSYVIYRILSAVCEILPSCRLAIFYAEADLYLPTKEEWTKFYESVPEPNNNLSMAERYEETHFQAIGVDETYDSDVFPGRNIGPLPTTVIAMPSFSLQRIKTILTFVESQYNVPEGGVLWYLGRPPNEEKNGWRYDALAALYNVDNDGVGLSTRDYREVLNSLEGVWERSHIDRHVVVVPLGSKMQHLATFLFLTSHPECGLVLCEPKEFLASAYSRGVGPKWWVDLGVVSELNALLRSLGTLQFNWSNS